MMPLIVTLLVALLQAIGGVLIGLGARTLPIFAGGSAQSLRAAWKNPYSPLLAGAVFAAGGLLLGMVILVPINRLYLLADLLVLVAALVSGAFAPRSLLERYGLSTVVPVGLGLFVIAFGLLVATEAINHGQMEFGLAWAVIAGVVGLGFLSAGLRSVRGRE